MSINMLIDLCTLQLFCPTHVQAQHIACRFLLQSKQPLLDCYVFNVHGCCASLFCVQNSQIELQPCLGDLAVHLHGHISDSWLHTWLQAVYWMTSDHGDAGVRKQCAIGS